MILNIISKNDPACLLTVIATKHRDAQSVLLITDGVMLLQQANLFTGNTINPVYFIAEDVQARGINKVIPSNAKPIDYDGFVNLVTQHESVVSW